MEDKRVRVDSVWSEAKDNLKKDHRYKELKRDLREAIFNEYK